MNGSTPEKLPESTENVAIPTLSIPKSARSAGSGFPQNKTWKDEEGKCQSQRKKHQNSHSPNPTAHGQSLPPTERVCYTNASIISSLDLSNPSPLFLKLLDSAMKAKPREQLASMCGDNTSPHNKHLIHFACPRTTDWIRNLLPASAADSSCFSLGFTALSGMVGPALATPTVAAIKFGKDRYFPVQAPVKMEPPSCSHPSWMAHFSSPRQMLNINNLASGTMRNQ